MIKTSVSQEPHEDGWENGSCLKELILKYKAPQKHWDWGKVEISILPPLHEEKQVCLSSQVSMEFWSKGKSVTRFLDASQGF